MSANEKAERVYPGHPGVDVFSASDLDEHAELPSLLTDRTLRIREGDCIVVYGPHAVMKTFMILDAVCDILQNPERRALLFLGEGHKRAIGRRLASLQAGQGRQHPTQFGDRLVFAHGPFPIGARRGRSFAKALAKQVNPDVILIDSMANYSEGDENQAHEVGQLLSLAKELSDGHTAVTITHHANKNGKEMRGSSAISAWADRIYLVLAKGHARELRETKSRDEAIQDPIVVDVEFGEDFVKIEPRTKKDSRTSSKARSNEQIESHALETRIKAELKSGGMTKREIREVVRRSNKDVTSALHVLVLSGAVVVGEEQRDDAAGRSRKQSVWKLA